MAEVGETDTDPAARRVENGGAQRATSGLPPQSGIGAAGLDENSVASGWAPLLRQWLAQAAEAGVAQPDAVVLGTLDTAGAVPRPVTRTVLCKGLSADGIVFYTNHESAKAEQLAATPFASATFLWPQLARQAHLRGQVQRVPDAVTQRYWRSRPRDSQLGAWASDQSQPIADRAELDRRLGRVIARFADTAEIPLPPHWGGYLLNPDEVEFWQGRHGRLHDRIVVKIDAAGVSVQRLQP